MYVVVDKMLSTVYTSNMFTWPYIQSGYSSINKIKFKIMWKFMIRGNVNIEVKLQYMMDLLCVDKVCVFG
jgi:hypothetical protein